MNQIKEVKTILALKLEKFNELCNELAQKGFVPKGDVIIKAANPLVFSQQWVLYNKSDPYYVQGPWDLE